jgi:hypothetical protein
MNVSPLFVAHPQSPELVTLADDLTTAKATAQAAFEKHECHAATDAQKIS